ncbi:MAG: hypothetical protein RJA76_944 [Bacteroidota bacterium]|jgi:rfaE bifunctional protein kinase chain/domain
MDDILLHRIFEKIKSKKIAVIGDFALDFYFNLQTKTKEFSVETEKEVFHANRPKSYLGGAGNVCKNLATIGNKPAAFGIIGADLFGREMLFHMRELNINHENIIIENSKGTPVYSKPMEGDLEYNRIDFGTTDLIDKTIKEAFLFQICLQLKHFDGIIINEQFFLPLLAKDDLLQLQEEIKTSQLFAIADLRSLGSFANEVILKINLKEFAHLIGFSESDLHDLEIIKIHVKEFLKSRKKGILLTLGHLGIMYADHSCIIHEPALPINGPIDTVGAGDMVVAAFSAAVLSGANLSEACQFANLCAHLSIHKIGETGSASPDEIIKLNNEF